MVSEGFDRVNTCIWLIEKERNIRKKYIHQQKLKFQNIQKEPGFWYMAIMALQL